LSARFNLMMTAMRHRNFRLFFVGQGVILLGASLSMIVVVFLGFGLFVGIATSNVDIQSVVDDDKRGRVPGLSTVAVIGMAPLGSILVGALSSRLGAQMTVFLGAAAFFVAALIFARKTPWPCIMASTPSGSYSISVR
jgi:hypothetical protein